MSAKVVVEHNYNFTTEQLWNVVIDGDCLREVMKGLAHFEGMPSCAIYTGQHIVVDVSLFGFMPKQKYEMHVLECNHETKIFRSREKGAGVKKWEHTGTVSATSTGSKLTDVIEIDAGLLTPIYAAYAKFMYKARHKPRLRILNERAQTHLA